MRRELAKWNEAFPFRIFDDLDMDIEKVRRNERALMNEFKASVDIEEDEGHWMMSFDLPGIPKEDVNIEVKDNVLRVWGERKNEVKNDSYIERSFGRFERAFSLPKNAQSDKVDAHFENGVLRVVVPKVEVKEAQKIDIKESNEGFWNKMLGSSKREEVAE
ncbi:MAG: Hsp20/alpha crystallin family protein [Bacteriovoracaceae bacterium]|nr:Hsp20/alpha crystallin family protein [Bacteriovoracaceae bacterium]